MLCIEDYTKVFLMKKIVIVFTILFIIIVGAESVFLIKLYRESQYLNMQLSGIREKLKIKEKEIEDINNKKEVNDEKNMI